MVAKEQHHVHDAHDWCTILDSNDVEEASLELLVGPYNEATLMRVGPRPLQDFLKSGDLREQHDTKEKGMTDSQILDEVYRRLKGDDPHGYKTNPLKDGVRSFIERERTPKHFLKSGDLREQHNTNTKEKE